MSHITKVSWQHFYWTCFQSHRPCRVPSSQASAVPLLWPRELRRWPSAYHWAAWTLAFEKGDTRNKFVAGVDSSIRNTSLSVPQRKKRRHYLAWFRQQRCWRKCSDWIVLVLRFELMWLGSPVSDTCLTHLSLTTLIVFIPLAAAICITACPTPLLAAFCITESPAWTTDWEQLSITATPAHFVLF